MASILRQIVAGPRAQHPEAGLDLCYVTDKIIATSGPGSTYPQIAYRNPLKDLVKFLDSKHGEKWAIWEFRAEGTGYPDSEVYGRVWHYPWPDHHPPPFALIPSIMASMRNWLKDKDVEGRVVVVHCKAGKGRSGTISCSYLISEEGWTPEDAMKRFTERRMRPGFGVGISIPSQQRYISYVDRWAKHGKLYVEQAVEILEVHVWGLRDGVKIVVEGYVDEGKVIKKFHTFHSKEREIVRGKISNESGFADVVSEALGRKKPLKEEKDASATLEKNVQKHEESQRNTSTDSGATSGDVVFRPSSRVVLPSSDINIDFERRNKTNLGGFTMVTSVAHVWFNTYFEGQGPEKEGKPDDSGVFEMDWDAMDGIKGSSRKGTRAFDKFAAVWKTVDVPTRKPSVVITQPQEGEEVKQAEAADWRGEEKVTEKVQRKLGIRPETDESANVSRASSVLEKGDESDTNDSAEELKGVKANLSNEGEDSTSADAPHTGQKDFATEQPQLDGTPAPEQGIKHVSSGDLPDGKPEEDMEDHSDHTFGHMKQIKNTESSS